MPQGRDKKSVTAKLLGHETVSLPVFLCHNITMQHSELGIFPNEGATNFFFVLTRLPAIQNELGLQ